MGRCWIDVQDKRCGKESAFAIPHNHLELPIIAVRQLIPPHPAQRCKRRRLATLRPKTVGQWTSDPGSGSL